MNWAKPSNSLGVPTLEQDGIVCTGEVYETSVELTVAQGAALPDPANLFNAGLTGGARRAVDVREGEVLLADPFVALVRAAIAFNVEPCSARRR